MSQNNDQKKVPTTKEQLIAMLKEQLEKVEDQITAMQREIQEERTRRKELTHQLQEKQTKIQDLLEKETKTLGDKVNEGLYNTLEAANKMRAEAQAQKRTLAEDNNILNEKITHRDSKVIEDRKNIELNTKKVYALEQKTIDLKRKENNLVGNKKQTLENLQMMKKQHERIEREELELRNHIENMKKLRLYLNKNLETGLRNLNGGLSKSRNKPASENDNFWN